MNQNVVFFDSEIVKRAMDSARRRALSKFGAYVRTRTKSSIRKRKRISYPGEPPSSHTGRLKKSIFFNYDQKNESVVVGPLRYGKNAASTLEHGGTSDGKLYRARPYMIPAFDKELPNAPKLFKDSIK